jgi:hypothetical protein
MKCAGGGCDGGTPRPDLGGFGGAGGVLTPSWYSGSAAMSSLSAEPLVKSMGSSSVPYTCGAAAGTSDVLCLFASGTGLYIDIDLVGLGFIAPPFAVVGSMSVLIVAVFGSMPLLLFGFRNGNDGVRNVGIAFTGISHVGGISFAGFSVTSTSDSRSPGGGSSGIWHASDERLLAHAEPCVRQRA